MNYLEAVKCVEQGLEVYRKDTYKYKPKRLKMGRTGAIYWLREYKSANNSVSYPKYGDIMATDYIVKLDGNVCYTMDDVINECIRLGCSVQVLTTEESTDQSPSV